MAELVLPAIVFVEVLKSKEQILLLLQFMPVHHGSEELGVVNAATLVHVNLHRSMTSEVVLQAWVWKWNGASILTASISF